MPLPTSAVYPPTLRLGAADDADATPLPFPDESADEIHLDHVLERALHPDRLLQEAHRILRHGGRLHLRLASPDEAWKDPSVRRPWPPKAIEAAARRHGFLVHELRTPMRRGRLTSFLHRSPQGTGPVTALLHAVKP